MLAGKNLEDTGFSACDGILIAVWPPVKLLKARSSSVSESAEAWWVSWGGNKKKKTDRNRRAVSRIAEEARGASRKRERKKRDENRRAASRECYR